MNSPKASSSSDDRLDRLKAVVSSLDITDSERCSLDMEIAALESSSDSTTTDALESVESGVIKGLREIRRELAADYGNIETPVVSRTKKQILHMTLTEIEVLLSNWEALIREARA